MLPQPQTLTARGSVGQMLSQPKTLTARGSVGRLEKKSDDMVGEFVFVGHTKGGTRRREIALFHEFARQGPGALRPLERHGLRARRG
jgi:hypothetical protein